MTHSVSIQGVSALVELETELTHVDDRQLCVLSGVRGMVPRVHLKTAKLDTTQSILL